MSALGGLLTLVVTVETYLGAGTAGDVYAPAVQVRVFVDDGLVRVQSQSGEQLVQKSTLMAELRDADVFVPQSVVTVNGRVSQVAAVRRREGGPVFSAVEHVEVDLT